ncbi:MAG: extracellular solute-binding protein [Clostridium sp.]|jgi:ABC-type glycerol-3-phosphate transport system substrate-binding protein|nr:extracellular solute-binding protein [Clostridium sp.]
MESKRLPEAARKRNGGMAGILLLPALAAVWLSGCGKGARDPSAGTEQGGQNGEAGYVYVSEYLSVETEGGYPDILCIKGNEIYYALHTWEEKTERSATELLRQEIGNDTKAEKLSLPLAQGESLMQFLVDEEGNYILLLSKYSRQETEEAGAMYASFFLCKYDREGTELFRQDLTAAMENGQRQYIQSLGCDAQGRFYLLSEQTVLLLQADGSYYGQADTGGYTIVMETGKDGNLYLTRYGMQGELEIVQIDFAAKAVASVYTGLRANGGSDGLFIKGAETDFLLADSSRLYTYDLASQSSETVFDWLDCDINGDYVSKVGVSEDGRILAAVSDWETGETSLVRITKTSAGEAAQKEIITLAARYEYQKLRSSAVKFNRSNDRYRVKIETYDGKTDEDIALLLNGAAAAGNAPDLIDLSIGIQVDSYVKKGLLEDLTPFLEASDRIGREDLVESVLNAFTYDGRLIGIPESFSLNVLAGKTSMVGEEAGWTVDEMVALSRQYPEASLLDHVSRYSILRVCYQQENFIDMETGKCRFDSEEFKNLLEYCKIFPEEALYDESDERSTPIKLQEGDVLLVDAYINNVEAFQMYRAMFGEPATYIGYPTADGRAGIRLEYSDGGAYAISSGSGQKEGAWAFLEFLLTQDGEQRYQSFPIRKDLLEDMLTQAMTPEMTVDENGEPKEDPKTTWGWGNDWQVEIYAAAQEDVARLRELIELAGSGSNTDSKIVEMIWEEAGPFFDGQKSVDEVADVIQSRVRLYVSENS